jgi:hypothetical protein
VTAISQAAPAGVLVAVDPATLQEPYGEIAAEACLPVLYIDNRDECAARARARVVHGALR